MSAQFTVATQEAREVLMKGIEGLKDNLMSHGINVDNVSIKLSDTQKSEYKQDWTEKLEGGANKKLIFKGFVESAEFDNLCNSYGIERGSINNEGVHIGGRKRSIRSRFGNDDFQRYFVFLLPCRNFLRRPE